MSTNGRSKFSRIATLALIIFLPGILFVWVGRVSQHNFESLEYYGPKELDTEVVNGDTITDTLYHRVPDLHFKDRSGQERSFKSLEGRAILVEFFQDKSLLKRLSVEFDGIPDVHFLSLVPDTSMGLEKVRHYADHVQSDSSQWTFALTPPERIEQFAIEGCFKGASSEEKIRKLIRHPVMVLIDEDHHVRGVYEGPHAAETDRMTDEIRLLLKELDQKEESS